MAQAFEEWYKQLPIITRSYLTLSVLTTAGCSLELITPYTLYFNLNLIMGKLQLWRLFTNFLYFGDIGVDFFFHMFFLSRYCKLLEENSFRGRTADFLFMLLFGGFLLLIVAPYFRVQFLGSSLSFMMVYVWSRRNPFVQMNFLGLFSFTAPYLPWVLMGFAVVLGSSPTTDILGMISGHVYYYLEDIYPRISGKRLLKTPSLFKLLFPEEEDPIFVDPAINNEPPPAPDNVGNQAGVNPNPQ